MPEANGITGTLTRPCSGRRSFDFSPWTSLPPLAEVAKLESLPASGPSLFERFIALCLLVLAAPVFLPIAIAITVESPGGPVFYRQERVGLDRRRGSPAASGAGDGRNGNGGNGGSVGGNTRRPEATERRQQIRRGKHFLIWKFRTMVPNAEAKTGPVWAMQNDPRITRIGRILRYLRFDELPQLINVVQGDMRLIGPRPERPQFVEQLTKAVPEYPRRLSVAPGITGLAQVQRDYDEDLDDVRTKLKYDLFYVDNRCAMLNFKILMKTVDVVVRGRGAH